MKRFSTILFLVSTLVLQACGGGADPVIRSAVSDTVVAPLPVNTAGMAINKPATPYDGYEGGLRVTRDTTNAIGGTRGYVNAASLTHSITGSGVTAFEWSTLTILDNYATAGENVALYAQANKRSRGSTWAAVSEANDTLGLGGPLVAHEFDLMTTGPDDGDRIGLDIIVGDGRFARGLGRSAQADATAAIRIGTMLTQPWATWGSGIEIGPVRDSAIKIKDASGVVVFEVKPNGDVYKQGVKVL